MTTRCAWATGDPIYIQYHDFEWGVPVHNDRSLFEFLILEGAQAGLSWLTILRKRENYRRAFDYFDPEQISIYDQDKVNQLLGDAGIIRNRLKVQSAITNAQAFLAIQDEFGSFNSYIWQFVGGKPIQNALRATSEIPARTHLSDAVSKELVHRGFRFIGSTIFYAYMQAIGMVNDHTINCFRYGELKGS